MNTEVISLVFSIPTYKRVKDLKRLICSIQCSATLAGEGIKVTLLIRDNDSESLITAKEIKSYVPDINVIYIKNKMNEGARANTWRALVKSSDFGDYVILASDDDYILPDFIPTISSHLRSFKTDYLVTNYYIQDASLNASYKQQGLQKSVLPNLIDCPKADIILSNRILTGTCYSSNLVKYMDELCEESFYIKQWYVQFIGCFSSYYHRIDSRLSIHQVYNQTYWEGMDNNRYEDIVVSRLKGYEHAYSITNGSSEELWHLILKSVLNYPLWIGLRVIISYKDLPLKIRLKYFLFKFLHIKAKRDVLSLISHIVKNR